MAPINISGALSVLSSDKSLVNNLPPELVQRLTDLFFILKAIGILVIIYVSFLIITAIMNFIRNMRIKKIYKKVYEIDQKLDTLLDKERKREERIEKRIKEKTEKSKEKIDKKSKDK
jgi:hypothetical protein